MLAVSVLVGSKAVLKTGRASAAKAQPPLASYFLIAPSILISGARHARLQFYFFRDRMTTLDHINFQ
jgi:hypothetical protein